MAFQDGSQESQGGDSQGLKQRLAIAQALMEKPSLLILDEPLNAVDSKSVAYFRRLFLELNEKEGGDDSFDFPLQPGHPGAM